MESELKKDEALVALAQKGDEKSFQELMQRYIGPIYNFARQYTKTDHDAEDVTQDTFFKVWKHLRRFDTTKSFRPWLYAIARNTSLDHVKSKRSSTFSELDQNDDELQFADSLEDKEPLPDEEFERKEIAAAVTRALHTLDPEHRSVMVMHYREGLTFNEIAEIMRRPMNTVKSWHQRALAKLRSLFASDGQ